MNENQPCSNDKTPKYIVLNFGSDGFFTISWVDDEPSWFREFYKGLWKLAKRMVSDPERVRTDDYRAFVLGNQ